jgi:hypothetical protein
MRPGEYGQTLAADFSRAYRKVHAVFGPDDAAVRLKADRATARSWWLVRITRHSGW